MKIGITGAVGNLGHKLVDHIVGLTYDLLLIDIAENTEMLTRWKTINPDINFIAANLCEYESYNELEGMDILIHFAGYSSERINWDLSVDNASMCFNIFDAAVKAGVKKIIYASSNHAVGGYWNDGTVQVNELKTNLSHKPGTKYTISATNGLDSTPYGSSKIFGERYGKMLVDSGALQAFYAIRIGACFPDNEEPHLLAAMKEEVFGSVIEQQTSNNHELDDANVVLLWLQNMWLSDYDFTRLFHAAIESDCKGFHIFNGVSNNEGMKWDLSNVQDLLGYNPKDDIHKYIASYE
eukprot:TRINITY_DN4020_c2_g2_i1.p1 TRINITY_DN4020_c2_g2~~TRINITY_DN4020_c2_g2_i1.p1  ORF type:complete len:295 (+),score=55.10 TRINITY_DN4020_c2_g2_i1:2-886(+)